MSDPKTFFIADTHFGEENIILYGNRPYASARLMDMDMFRKWNDTVGDDDIVYHLGDFGAVGYEEKLLKELKGQIYLIKGNHDKKSNAEYRDYGFKEVYDFPIIWNDFYLLSHQPKYMNAYMPYALFFGHIHCSPLYKTVSPQSFCVSAERINYTPISFEEIREAILRERSQK